MAVIVGIFLAKLLSPIVAIGGLLAGWFIRNPANLALAIVAIVVLEEVGLRVVSLTRSTAPAAAVVLACVLAAVAAALWAWATRYIRLRRSA